jgi:hypothetical protein
MLEKELVMSRTESTTNPLLPPTFINSTTGDPDGRAEAAAIFDESLPDGIFPPVRFEAIWRDGEQPPGEEAETTLYRVTVYERFNCARAQEGNEAATKNSGLPIHLL